MIRKEEHIAHYGVLGMKWGRRKSRSDNSGQTKPNKKKTSSSTSTSTKKKDDGVNTKKSEPEKTRKNMTNDELKVAIERLRLEKDFKTLNNEMNSAKRAKATKLFGIITEKSVENIGTQVATLALGTLVNRVGKTLFNAKTDWVNPKKGQKDGKK